MSTETVYFPAADDGPDSEAWKHAYDSFDARRVREFLKRNGWVLSDDTETIRHGFESWYFPEGIGLDIQYDSDAIVFIGEWGDFGEVPINYYALIGFLLECKSIHKYKSVPPKEVRAMIEAEREAAKKAARASRRELPPPNIPPESPDA